MASTRRGFGYAKTKSIYLAYYRDGAWQEGKLQQDDQITITAFATGIHYGQAVFEGLKAYQRQDGDINLFRIKDNAVRFAASCERMVIPPVPVTLFESAIKETVLDNQAYIPSYGNGETLYIRPIVIGLGPVLGALPAKEYLFMVLVSPVGPYFEGGLRPVRMMVTSYDRAAPNGTGKAKCGGNYGGSFYPQKIAREHGCAEALFLDPTTHQFIEEAGAANFFAITKSGQYVTPVSSSILDSITQKSLKVIASQKLGLTIVERPIHIDELSTFIEAGACGTAAVITPIGEVLYHDQIIKIGPAMTTGPISQKLYDLITGIQFGDLSDDYGWMTTIKRS